MAESGKIQLTNAFCNIRTGTAVYFHELEGAEFVINDGKVMGYIINNEREREQWRENRRNNWRRQGKTHGRFPV